jgi:hypothetical protein
MCSSAHVYPEEGLIKYIKYEKGKIYPITCHEGMWGEVYP